MSPPFREAALRAEGLGRRSFIAVAAAAAAWAAPASAKAFQREGASPLAGLEPRYPLLRPDGDAFEAMMAYEPDKDSDAAFFRSCTPRATVIAPFAETQAHPKLDPRPRVGTLVTPYGPLDPRDGDGFARRRSGVSPSGKVFVPRMTAWHDIVVGWGATGMIPNPAMTDAAHRNGALALGVIFQPDRRLYDASAAPQRAVAAKLVGFARWFGFDGYFVNFEGGDARSHAQILDLVALMRRLAREESEGDFHVQFYDGQTALESLAPILDGSGPPADSVMLDQGWSAYSVKGCCSGAPLSPETFHDASVARRIDPFNAYFGLQLYPGPAYLDAAAPTVIAPNGEGPAFGSLQLYSADDGLRTLLRAARANGAVGSSPAAGRRALYALERQLYSGVSENPALDNRPSQTDLHAYAPTRGDVHAYTHYEGATVRPTDQAGLPMSYGVANFATERSVIGGAPFVTHFNTGEGDSFWIGGERASETAWFDMGAQDLLPTWQWRREPLTRPFDPAAPQPELLSVDYDFDLAFDGGSSLRISGPLTERTALKLWLFKSALPITRAQALRLVFQGAGATVDASVGLAFADKPQRFVWLPFCDAQGEAAGRGWRRTRIDLAPFAGRTLAAILLRVAPSDPGAGRKEMGLNIGELFVGAELPDGPLSAPRGLRLLAWAPEANGRFAEARIGWDHDTAAAYYDVFHVRDGGRVWLGRVNGDRSFARLPPARGGREGIEVVVVLRAAPLRQSPVARITLPARPGRRV